MRIVFTKILENFVNMLEGCKKLGRYYVTKYLTVLKKDYSKCIFNQFRLLNENNLTYEIKSPPSLSLIYHMIAAKRSLQIRPIISVAVNAKALL